MPRKGAGGVLTTREGPRGAGSLTGSHEASVLVPVMGPLRVGLQEGHGVALGSTQHVTMWSPQKSYRGRDTRGHGDVNSAVGPLHPSQVVQT